MKMDSKISSKCTKPLVAAIALGTMYSGYAFSLKDNWGKVLFNVWQGGSILSFKAPTCLLLKKDLSETLFGYEAEDKYSNLTAENKHKDYYFFRWFGMLLQDDVDIGGKPMEASIVFMHCIKYLKNHLHEVIKKSMKDIKEIHYVLTVPAKGGDEAKMFIREAAVKAGIENERLIIALKPEAVSIYYQYLCVAKEDPSAMAFGVLKPGTKYMVVHLGGASAYVTVHEKCAGNLENILMGSGGPWGGHSVDDQFIKSMTELVGEEFMRKFKEENMGDYLDIMRTFETKKRTIKPEKDGNTNMSLPQSFFKLSAQAFRVKDFKEIIDKNEKHRNNVKYAAGKLKWENKYFRGFFQKTIDSIVKHIDEVFENEVVRDVDFIVMVGGFSECELVQDAIKKNFKQKRIMIPDDAGLGVLKGAVYIGHFTDVKPRTTLQSF